MNLARRAARWGCSGSWGWGRPPLPGETPACRALDRSPYDRRAAAGIGALPAQVALLSDGLGAR